MKNTRPMLGGAMAILAATMMAGCQGSFNVEPTGTFHVQIDGAPQTVIVREGDAAPQQVAIEKEDNVEEMDVKVDVKSTSSEDCVILVTIIDGDTKQTLVTKEIHVDVTVGGTTSPPANGTTTTTPAASPTGGSVTQIINVDVRGKNNVIVVTEAQEGSAEVGISATAGTTASGTTTPAPTTTTAAPTTTTAAPTTTTTPYSV